MRFAPDDLSSTVSSWILRPFTPPFAFWASTRAWHASPESWKFGAATPVPDQMNPSLIASLETPGTLPDCALAAVPASVTPSTPTATMLKARAARL